MGITIVLLIGMAFVILRGPKASEKASPLHPEPVTPPAKATEQKKEGPASEQPPKHVHSQMEFVPEKESQDNNETAQFDESITRKKREMKITPGVVYESGKGINMKMPGTEESIQIRRDNTYRAGEYRVQWEKKF